MCVVLDCVAQKRWAMIFLSSLIGVTIGAHATVNDQGDGSDPDPDTDQSNEHEIRYEEWAFVSIPEYGVVPMQDALTPDTESNQALLHYGAPFEAYEPVAIHATNQNRNNGAVLIYMLSPRCLGDFNNDGVVDVYDTSLFLDAFLAEDPSADLTQDGVIDILDQMAFVVLTTMPCVDYWAL